MGDEHTNGGRLGAGPSRRTVLRSLTAGALGTLTVSPATASTLDIRSSADGLGPTLIERDDEAGFSFPYYLYAPPEPRAKPALVEPVNSGACNDDFQTDLNAAQRLVSGGVPRQISDELRVPLLVPVFANPCSDAFWNRFIQTLDTETMHIDSGRFERIDLQLLSMVDDARRRLADAGLDLPETIMMNGFSASGNFVNNFAVLHPERVASVTAGAVNGMATLPRSEAMGRTVNYQIGVADLESLTGSAFDEAAWQEVPQLCYMGEDERSPNDDTLPYRDVWSEEQAQLARTVYGDDMQSERMVYSDAVYHAADAPGRFEVYDDTGHSYSDRIVNDVVSFHRQHNEIESGSFTETPAAGMEQLSIDVFVAPDDADRLVARAFVDGTDVTADPVRVLPDVPNQLSIELTTPLAVDDTVSVGLFEPGDEQLSAARLIVETTVTAEARFVTAPEPGDTTVEVSYALSESADSSAVLSLVPAGSGQYWQRRIRLVNVRPGEGGTETFKLDTGNQGIPIESGDEVELWLIPSGNQVPERATAIETVSVGDGASESTTEQLQASSCGETLTHDAVDVQFARRPTGGDETVEIEYAVEESFGQRVRIRLFPETGGGQWGEGLDFVDAGSSGVESYDIPANLLTVGETVEIRAFPADWSTLDDVIATDCALVSGVRFERPPSTGDSEVAVRYAYPDAVPGEGRVEVVIDDTVVSAVENVQAGTLERRTIGVDPIPGGVDVSVRLRTSNGERIDSAGLTTRPDGYASLRVADGPAAYDRSLSLEYGLSAAHEVERFCTLRLYNGSSSSWGILLDRVQPGDSAAKTVEISVDEPGVPFAEGDELEIALVDWDDPYATRPLAETTIAVGETVENEAGEGPGDSETETETGQAGGSNDGTETAAGEDGTATESESAGTQTESGSAPGTEDNTPTATDGESTDGQSTEAETPGFGVGSSIAGLGGVAYLLKRRLDSGETAEQERQAEDSET